ncbi:MAG: U32 family peptidase [Nanoarchaeota archaeon]|nr:U32 family peptidase [Nanoarchaeota archaeon]MBU1704300.1 U32 family peptidase [Nanoarchaeota archaeon]
MKIVAPLDNVAETGALLKGGADEIFCGVLTERWQKLYSDIIPPNKRGMESNLHSFAELAKVVNIAHSYGKKVALTLNAPFYSDEQVELVKEQVSEAVKTDVDAIICSDPWLIRFLQEFKGEVHISTIGVSLNSETISFYKALGAKRIILPRHLSHDEIVELSKKNSNKVDLEIFGLNESCENVDGYCGFYHRVDEYNKKLFSCRIPYDIEIIGSKNMSINRRIKTRMDHIRSCSSICGGCSIPEFKNAGLSFIKICGRGMPTSYKVKDISFIRFVIDNTDKITKEEIKKKYLEVYGRQCSLKDCYYPR